MWRMLGQLYAAGVPVESGIAIGRHCAGDGYTNRELVTQDGERDSEEAIAICRGIERCWRRCGRQASMEKVE